MSAEPTQHTGRPSKILDGWNPDTGEWDETSIPGKLLAAIRGGNYREVAARWAGVDPGNLRRWMSRGAEHAEDRSISAADRPYVLFRAAVERAETAYEIEAVLRMTRAAETPESILRILGRRHPERWGANREQLNVNLSGQVDATVTPGGIAAKLLADPAKREAALSALDLLLDDEPEDGVDGQEG